MKNNFFYRIICGFFLGISVVGPGISGSVMAVMMGVYNRLIEIAANPFKQWKKNFLYLLPMGIGAVISLILFVIGFKYLFEIYPTPTYLLFIALIIGSLPSVYRKVKGQKIKVQHLVAFVLALAMSVSFSVLNQQQVVLNIDTGNFLYLMVCGLLVGAAAIVPGMSISIMMMLMNVYERMLNAAFSLDVLTIIPFAACFVIGLCLFSKVVKSVFEKHETTGYYAVIGFMLGSALGVFPPLASIGSQWLMSVIFILIGLGLSIAFGYLAKVLKTED